MKSHKLMLVVGLVVLCLVAASLYAIADCGKSGCGQKPAGAKMGGCGQMAKRAGNCGATSACFSDTSKVVTRAYYGGTVKLRAGGCPMGCRLAVAVLKQGDRPDANSSVTAELRTGTGRQRIPLKRLSPGVFCSNGPLGDATSVDVNVTGGGALSSTVNFKLPAASLQGCAGRAAGGCGMNKAGGCPMMKQAGGCKAMGEGKCSGMKPGGCATAGACKQAGKTPACKCAVCKCAPCKCK